MKNCSPAPVRTALLLAAGTGSRLHPLTRQSPKCLTELHGQPIIARLIAALEQNGIRRLVVVVGYLGMHIRDYLNELDTGLVIEFVGNSDFRTTNNIYSLWLARSHIREPFLLVECDVVFGPGQLERLMTPDRMAVSQRLPWMNGSTVTVNREDQVTVFHAGSEPPEGDMTFKTVNIYSFSLRTWERVAHRLGRHIGGDLRSGYYETVLAELIAERRIALEAVFFDEDRWYEVDTVADLHAAERMFPVTVGGSEPAYV